MYQISARYVLRLSDQARIPMDDPALPAFQEYLQWVGQGNHPAPAPKDAAQLALEALEAQSAVDAAAAHSYGKLQALSGMTPAQVQIWVANNVTNLAQAQDAIATLAIAVSVLARRL